MFDSGFCARLMDMGYRDVMAECGRVREFLDAPAQELSRLPSAS